LLHIFCGSEANTRSPITFSSLQDASDPDLELPNKLHLLQTAEGIRHAGHPDWLQLTGLLHDMGKIMFLWGTGEDGQDGYSPKGKQWALGGDTFAVGCQIPDNAVVFPAFNKFNPDMHNPAYNTAYGMYKPHCGLDKLCFAWGHDEYMYRMLVANETTIPREGLDMIRYHSDPCTTRELTRTFSNQRTTSEWAGFNSLTSLTSIQRTETMISVGILTTYGHTTEDSSRSMDWVESSSGDNCKVILFEQNQK
jgi:hypothetical protein